MKIMKRVLFAISLIAAGVVSGETGVPSSGARVLTADARFLMLPVKNGAPVVKARVLVGDSVFRTFDIPFAPDAPDWYAALDIASVKGASLTVAVDGASADALARVKTAAEAPVPDGYDGTYRPQFHFSPQRGWNNDPNGLSWYDGEWHLFFQHNPYGVKWGNMHWGHAVSSDLLHWRELGDVLAPDATLGAMFSGSAVIDRDNTAGFGKGAHVLIFTGTANGSAQSLAYSLDGRNYVKWSGNPVLPCVTPDNRDPRVFWHAPSHRWVLALYVKENGRHNVVIFNSPDLKAWTRAGTIPGDMDGKGRFLYECPELFELPVSGETTCSRWIVFGANGEYAVGIFDGRTFTPEERRIPMNRGFVGYYAAQTFGDAPDGRRILLPWFRVGMPGMPFNQMMGLPRELGLVRTPNGLRLRQSPVKEIESLRDGPAKALGDFEGDLAEVSLDVRPAPSARIVFSLRGIRVVYDAARELLEIPGGTTSWPLENGRFRARMFIDRAGMETFSTDGLVCLPSVTLADPGNLKLSIVEGADRILDDRSSACRLKRVWNNGGDVK